MSIPPEEQPHRNPSRARRPSSWSEGPARINSGIGRQSQPQSDNSINPDEEVREVNLNSPEPAQQEAPAEPSFIQENEDGDVTARVGMGWRSAILQEPEAGPSQLPEPGDDSQYQYRIHPLAGIPVRSRAPSPIESIARFPNQKKKGQHPRSPRSLPLITTKNTP